MHACGSGQSNYLYYLFSLSGAKAKYIGFWVIRRARSLRFYLE